jgi:hypothetical protein
VDKLKQIHAPTYVVGIDIDRQRGYIIGITQASTGGIYGIPVRHSLNKLPHTEGPLERSRRVLEGEGDLGPRVEVL